MPRFDGFQSHDFSGGIAGTTWRGRDSLGGVLAAALGNHAESKQPFQSWGISRRPELFLAPIKHFHGEANAEAGVKRCKLFVRAEPSGLRYGLWLEKGFDTLQVAKTPADVMDDSWDWPRLAQLLQDSSRESDFLDLFHRHGFHLYSEVVEGKKTSLHTVLAQPDGTLILETDGGISPVKWSQVCDLLTKASGSAWVDVYLIQKALDPTEAISRGATIANDIVESFRQLLPIFNATSGYTSSIAIDNSTRTAEARMTYAGCPTPVQLAAYLDSSLGLRFTPYQIACYVTALQTKGFVILSGMSGTGKTKLAQEFAHLLNADSGSEPDGGNYLFLPVHPDWRDNKALVGYYNPLFQKYESTELLRFILDAQEEREAPRQASLAEAVRTALQTSEKKSWLADLRSLQQRLTGKQAGQLTPHELDLLWIQKDNGVASIGQAVATSLQNDDRLQRATEIVMDTKHRTPGQRFADAVKVLAPPNHWARVWRAVATFDLENVHTIVHGKRVQELLAYLQYPAPQDPRDLAERNKSEEIDKGLKFIMDEVKHRIPGLNPDERAIAPWLMWEYFDGRSSPSPKVQQDSVATAIPFFLLLDEMNLAHVEHYFADFLSVLEGGRLKNGLTTEKVRLHSSETPVEDTKGQLIQPTLALPPNLYFVGTVNVDETTHTFSPKVLDRAFTIEFETADLSTYPTPSGGSAAPLSDDQQIALRNAFVREGRFAVIEKTPTIQNFHGQHGDFMLRLRELETLLRPHELHFGYRVVDEILMYLANAEKYGWFKGLGELEAAFDSAILMKVLPKFHGPRARLKEPLRKLLTWAGMPPAITVLVDTDQPDYPAAIQSLRDQLPTVDYLQFRCPRTALKCLRMMYQLHTTGFASFN